MIPKKKEGRTTVAYLFLYLEKMKISNMDIFLKKDHSIKRGTSLYNKVVSVSIPIRRACLL